MPLTSPLIYPIAVSNDQARHTPTSTLPLVFHISED